MSLFRNSSKELESLKERKHYVNRWNSSNEEIEKYIKNSNEPITLVTHDKELFEFLGRSNQKEWLIQPYMLNDSVYRDWNPFFWSNRYETEGEDVCGLLERADKAFLCKILQDKLEEKELLQKIQYFFHHRYDEIMHFKKVFNLELHLKEFHAYVKEDMQTMSGELFKNSPLVEKEFKRCEENIESISPHNTCFQLMRSSLAVKNNHIIILIEKNTLSEHYYFHLLNHLLLKRSLIIPQSKVVFGMVDFIVDKELLQAAEHLIATQRNYGMTYFIKQPKLEVNDLDKNSPLYSHQYFSLICANNETSS